MGLIRAIVGLPTAPLRGAIAAADQVYQHAERRRLASLAASMGEMGPR